MTEHDRTWQDTAAQHITLQHRPDQDMTGDDRAEQDMTEHHSTGRDLRPRSLGRNPRPLKHLRCQGQSWASSHSTSGQGHQLTDAFSRVFIDETELERIEVGVPLHLWSEGVGEVHGAGPLPVTSVGRDPVAQDPGPSNKILPLSKM